MNTNGDLTVGNEAMSPPLSITAKAAPASCIASTPNHAIVPATAAIGPTPAGFDATAIRCATGGEDVSGGA